MWGLCVHMITCALRQILCSSFVMHAYVQAIAAGGPTKLLKHLCHGMRKGLLADEETLAEEEVHQ